MLFWRLNKWNSYILLINCDPSESVFLLLTISLKQLLRSALQNFVKVKRKDLWWSSSSKGTCCNLSRKDFIKGLSCEIFQNNSFQNNFRRMFLFRELALRRPIKTKSIWFGSLNKKIPLTSNRSYLVKQLFQKVEIFCSNMSMMKYRFNKVKG